MKSSKRIILSVFFIFLSSFSFAKEKILSDYTQKKVEEFSVIRISLKSSPHAEAVEKIAEVWKESFEHLKENALDYEQESLLLESLYYMETYERSVTKVNRAELRAKMKDLMLRNFAYLDKTDKKKVCAWFFLVSGDVTSYYMTRSVSATFRYGMKVKSLYEAGVAADNYHSNSNVSLGSWYFYAPGIFGGSNKKAERCYKNAIQGAVTDGDRFLAYEFLSQLYFEQKKYDECKLYIQKARALGIGTKELDLVESCNEKGFSLYQYNRNKVGIDEEIPDSEKDDDDKDKVKI